MRYIAGLLLLVAFPSFAQVPACPAAPADPVARDQARISWGRPTQYTDGSAIASTTTLTYTVYERVGSTDTARCTTTAVSAGQTGLAPGAHTWVVTTRIGTGAESAKSNAASKTIAEPVPGAPLNVTVASTRIEPYEFTCRDGAGAVLTNHRQQSEAQTECTNRALASLGTAFEVRPSGYRIVARQ